MSDSVAVFSPLDFVSDNNGNPVANGTIEFYDAGTTTPKTVYSDNTLSTALGTSVSTNASGYPVTGGGSETLIYVGTADYKIIVKDSLGATLRTRDNIKGAVSVPATSELALPEMPVISKTANYTITAADQGKIINCNPTSSSFAITLPTIPNAEDGFLVTLRHNANTTNTVSYRTTGTDTARIPGQNTTAGTLKGWGQSVTLAYDGSDWIAVSSVPPVMLDGLPYFSITDRLTTPPTSPTGGARYIISGSPTGAWSTLGFSANQVVESNGNGSWFAYTPSAGWLAYVIDEDLFTKWDGSSWEDQTGMSAPSSSTLKAAVFENSLSNGTVGGTGTAGAWTVRPLETSAVNTITGASLASNQITLPVGVYIVSAWQQIYDTTRAQSRIKVISGTATPTLIHSQAFAARGTSATGGATSTDIPPAVVFGVLTVTATAVIELQYFYTAATSGTSTLGLPSTEPDGSNEIYARVTILSVASLQGPQGIQGPQGVAAARVNALMNGAMMVAQEATSFTSGTTPANNNDTYTLDGWNLLSDGNNIVNVAQSTDAPANGLNSLSMTVATANKKFGIAQFVEQKDSIGIIGQTCTLSFQAKVSALTNLDNIKAAIITWDGTADTVTSAVVSAWNAEGTNPTLGANWTYENTPTTLSVGTSWGSFSVTAAIDTAGAKNIGVLIWSDVTATTITTDILYITNVQLEPQATASTFFYEPYEKELARCMRYWQRLGGIVANDLQFRSYGAAAAIFMTTLVWPVTMRTTPTGTIMNSGGWTLSNCTSLTFDGLTRSTGRIYVTISALGSVFFAATDTTTYIKLDARL